MPKMEFWPEKNCRAKGLKLGVHTQLDSGSNMGWVPLGHTSSFWCVRLKMPKNGILVKHLDLGPTLTLIYLVSVSSGEHFKNVYRSISFPVSCQTKKKKKKRAKNGTYAKLLSISLFVGLGPDN